MNPVAWFAVYTIIWWLVFVMILPMGVKSHEEAGVEPPPGVDKSAPVEFDFKAKAWKATWISVLVFVPFVALILSGLVQLPDLPKDYGL